MAHPLPASASPQKKSSALLFAGVGLAVLLLIAGVGGYFVMTTMMNKPAANTAKTDSPTNPATTDIAAGHETGRYWLELNTENQADRIRAGESLTMTSDQQFKFHFSPNQYWKRL